MSGLLYVLLCLWMDRDLRFEFVSAVSRTLLLWSLHPQNQRIEDDFSSTIQFTWELTVKDFELKFFNNILEYLSWIWWIVSISSGFWWLSSLQPSPLSPYQHTCPSRAINCCYLWVYVYCRPVATYLSQNNIVYDYNHIDTIALKLVGEYRVYTL